MAWVPIIGIVRLFDHAPWLRTASCFRRLGRMLAKVNPWRLHISGQEHAERDKVYVVVSNHQSLADIPVVAHLKLNTKWLAKEELFHFPIVGWMMRISGDVPVERANIRKAAKAILQCGRYLRQGCSVIFFPEGTRSLDGQVLPFNEGPFQLAIREQVPVLPLVVEGSGTALPKHTLLFGATQDIHLRILEPVSAEGWNIKQTSDLRDLVRQKIIDELARLRSPAARRP